VAAIFRQVAMNRFEHVIHTARREQGELAADRFAELWLETQADLLGDAVELHDDYGIWWSYIPHFVDAPGYVYAYAYGNLWPCRSTAATRRMATASSTHTSSCCARAALGPPRSSAASWGWT
jgi:oligoendopeptidase F